MDIGRFIKEERKIKTVYPETADKIFRCFKETPLNDVKVVILGQDPYHDGSATGLAFANENKDKMSPSLKNILDEVYDDIYGNIGPYPNPNLEHWAKQGVLLLNKSLTVVKGIPLSHVRIWEPFTDYVIAQLARSTTGLVFLCWGSVAKSVVDKFVNPSSHYILYAGHPSPLNKRVQFKGCKHFSKTNEILYGMNGITIKW